MANIDGEIVWQANDNTWFTTNAAEVYPAGLTIYHVDGRYKFTDGVTALSALSFLGNSSSGVQSVTGNSVDNTDPLNPIVLEQTQLISPDQNTNVSAFNAQASIGVTDGVDNIATIIVQPDSIVSEVTDGTDTMTVSQTPSSFTKNGTEIATEEYVNNLSSTLITRTSDTTNTLNTGVDIPDLTFAMAANSEYFIEGKIRVACSSTGGNKYATTVPTGTTFYSKYFGKGSSITNIREEITVVSGTLTTNAHNTVATTSTVLDYYAHVITGATTGNWTLQIASGVSGQTSTVYALATSVIVTKK